jgi:hypothetical protein
MLRALRGEITTNTAYQIVANARELFREGHLDDEALAALNVGDKAHRDDPRRFEPLDRTWEYAGDTDPATEAAFDALTRREDFAGRYQPTGDEVWDSYDHEPRRAFIDWPEFWADDGPDDEWLYDQVFARGRGHAVYASHKQGKSLFVLWVAAHLATTRTDVDVIYLDYEMTRNDVRERLEDMGYGPGTDLTRLYYALLPSIPPLDTLEGMNALMELVRQVERPDTHLFVVIDTTARAAHGEENRADTYRDFYRWTGTALKRHGITWVRLDHAGKDPLKGQRGSSSKGDDVDVVWRLQQADNGMVLHRDVARMSWVPEKLTYTICSNPLRYERSAFLWPDGTAPTAKALDELGLPVTVTRREAATALKAAGRGVRNEVVSAAIRYRKPAQEVTVIPVDNPVDNPVENLGDHAGDQTRTVPGDQPAGPPTENALTSGDQPGDHRGPKFGVTGDQGPPLKGDQVPTRPPQATRTCRCGQPATDISGLCPACIANPGTLPPIPPHERF